MTWIWGGFFKKLLELPFNFHSPRSSISLFIPKLTSESLALFISLYLNRIWCETSQINEKVAQCRRKSYWSELVSLFTHLKESPSLPLPSKSEGDRLPRLCLDLMVVTYYLHITITLYNCTWTSSLVFVFLPPDSHPLGPPWHWSFVLIFCVALGNYSLQRKYFDHCHDIYRVSQKKGWSRFTANVKALNGLKLKS